MVRGLNHGWFYEPTIFSDVTPEMRIAKEEIFGPVLSGDPFELFRREHLNSQQHRYGLSSSIYTRDVNKAFVAIRDIKAGITYINVPTIGAEAHLPFGGVKQTGNGHREEAGPCTISLRSGKPFTLTTAGRCNGHK